MDSGNSGSVQSSSGGEDEYDSRGDSISSFLNPAGHFGSISSPQPSFLLSQQHTFFDPRSQNLDAFIQQSSANPNANTQYNNDLVWTRNLRSDQSNYANFGNLTAGSSSRTQEQSDAQPNSTIKNPKKRPRASRRAPTTVLTTDTANFRQMVQDFTGIPAAPFSGPPYSRRLDLLSTVRSSHLDTLGSLYPLRPSAQKIVPPQPLLHSPSLKNQFGQVFGTLRMSHDQQVEANLGGFSNSAGAQERTEGHMQDNMGGPFGGNISSEFHSAKELENVSSAADGTMNSWICPSD
ncbi:vq motif-containing protein [Abeliophyllum distichum]|uniref:Vq motif-containing protein n=1 Tax=Abeliophyllum distichum TaxID=126358 RepID=A0ABD1SSZ7_9LAMI